MNFWCLIICSTFFISADGQQDELIILRPQQNFIEIEAKPGIYYSISSVNKSSEIAFSILQANVYMGSVTLSYNRTLTHGYFTTGSNIGLVLYNIGETDVVYLQNSNEKPLRVLLGLQDYDINAPIPGNCNMEQSIRTAPFLPTRFTSSLIIVEYPLASWPLNVNQPLCDGSPLQYDIYQLYLPEKDMTTETLFSNIKLMSDWKSIEMHGKKVEFLGEPICQILFANYIGTGRIVAVIVRSLTSSAAYVPTASYGCIESDADAAPCSMFNTIGEKLFAAGLFFVGLFLTTLGHRFFKSQVFIVGFCIGSVLSYILLYLLSEPTQTNAALIVISVGVASGIILLLLWAWLGVPILPIFIGSLILGFLFASVVLYSPLADVGILKDNTTYWLAFLCIILIGPLILISFPLASSLLFSTLVGSYLLIFSLDQYVGGNLRFILLNTLRRAMYPNFRSAIIQPPFQSTDIVLTLFWILLACIGTAFQFWRECGRRRAPFPPPPKWPSWLEFSRIPVQNNDTPDTLPQPNESTPLLS